MVEKRENDRIAFISMGIVDGKSEQISCSLENISKCGALICMSGPISGTLQLGDIVRLKAILLTPVEFQCKVTRIDADRIAMQFLN